MRIAIVGIQGLPNTYGGFETLADYLVQYLSEEFSFTVYCSSVDNKSELKQYCGSTLKYIPITSHGSFGMIYDSISFIQAIKSHDKVLFLGFGAGLIMPFFKKYRSKIILNIGGLDWQRSKWSNFAQYIIKKSEALLINNSGEIISDNKGIQDYIKKEYGRESTLITYGGDQTKKQEVAESDILEFPFLTEDFAFSVTRIQPDNNIDLILEAFTGDEVNIPIVMVGNWQSSTYGKATRHKFHSQKNMILLDAIYDRRKLDVLRSNCTIYIHGHSAGGTNPSLVEAMHLGLPIFAFASGFNEYTTENKAFYFKSSEQLRSLIINHNSINLVKTAQELKRIAVEYYTWKAIANEYKKIFLQ